LSRPPETGPLAGLRVLELANLYSAPLIAALLGDLGADVVKVEPPDGEPFRALVARDADGGPSVWTLVSRHKRMVAVDHRHPEGIAFLGRLTAAADVIVANQPRAVLERMGCTYEAISARNHRAIMVNVSGWGDAGPYADRGGNGTIAEAFGGLTQVMTTGDEPVLSGALLGDCLTALSGTIGVLAACYWRAAAGGEGQYIEMPMFEAVMTAVAPQIVSFRPGEAPKAGSGLRRVLRTADGRWVVATAYTAAQIVRLLEAVGVDASDPGGLDALVSEWVGRHDLDTVMAAFTETRIPSTPVNDVGALLADAHVQARGAVVEAESPVHGPVRLPRPTPHLTRTPGTPAGFAERPLGADTAAVCADWLGLSADEIDGLREAKVLV
jgi:crotonobetainyl-CoA:carnitine CoA-transferase CaiB-like acyl-CoA transferase